MTMIQPSPDLPEIATADDPHVRACTDGGVEHDYRPHVMVEESAVRLAPATGDDAAPTVADTEGGEEIGDVTLTTRTYLRCVWCHGITCGSVSETDPCIEPYHHRVPHRTRMGLTWPTGSPRPKLAPR